MHEWMKESSIGCYWTAHIQLCFSEMHNSLWLCIWISVTWDLLKKPSNTHSLPLHLSSVIRPESFQKQLLVPVETEESSRSGTDTALARVTWSQTHNGLFLRADHMRSDPALGVTDALCMRLDAGAGDVRRLETQVLEVQCVSDQKTCFYNSQRSGKALRNHFAVLW